MSVKIITDIISDINSEVAQKYDIEVMPIKIIVDGKTKSAQEITIEEMVVWIERNKKIPEFKGVSSEEYTEIYRKYINLGYDIVCITAGDIAISNYDCAMYATTQFPDANIHVINTNRFSGNVGLLAVMASKMAADNKSAQEIADMCKRNLEKNKQTSLMDSLDFLQYAGAVPKILSAGTNLFNAKFSFSMNKDDDRDAEIIGYSMDKAVDNFCKKVFKNISAIKRGTVFLTHTISDKDYYKKIYDHVVGLDYFEDIVTCESSHFNTSFVGRNCMTVTYQLK